MIKLAVRVVKALPPVEKMPAVPALEFAAAVDGTERFSSPCPARPTLRINVFAGAPVIAKVPNKLPSLSVTDTVTLLFIATALETA